MYCYDTFERELNAVRTNVSVTVGGLDDTARTRFETPSYIIVFVFLLVKISVRVMGVGNSYTETPELPESVFAARDLLRVRVFFC